MDSRVFGSAVLEMKGLEHSGVYGSPVSGPPFGFTGLRGTGFRGPGLFPLYLCMDLSRVVSSSFFGRVCLGVQEGKGGRTFWCCVWGLSIGHRGRGSSTFLISSLT